MRRRLAWSLVLGPLGIALAMACSDPSHVYAGRRFVDERGCVQSTTSLDVVTGDPAESSCAPTCLAQPHPDGGRSIYVSTMCAPYPFRFDASGADPVCPAALAAATRNDTCFDDGGSRAPLPPVPDASTD